MLPMCRSDARAGHVRAQLLLLPAQPHAAAVAGGAGGARGAAPARARRLPAEGVGGEQGAAVPAAARRRRHAARQRRLPARRAHQAAHVPAQAARGRLPPLRQDGRPRAPHHRHAPQVLLVSAHLVSLNPNFHAPSNRHILRNFI